MKIINKRRNGFTLIELLGVVTILGMIALIVTPPIINNIKNSNEKINKASLQYIYAIGESYIKDNSNDFTMTSGTKLCIKINDLLEDGRFKEGVLKESNIEPRKYLLYNVLENQKLSYKLNLYNNNTCTSS